MALLTKKFKTASRDEIVELCDQIAEIIRKELISNPDRTEALIIKINGNIDAGKSIFWDEIRQRLLKFGGIFVKNKSNSQQIKEDPFLAGRRYETWIGDFDGRDEPLKIFLGSGYAFMFAFQNIDMCQNIVDCLKRFNGKKPKELADVIILTNYEDMTTPANEDELTIEIEFTTKRNRMRAKSGDTKNNKLGWRRNIITQCLEHSPFAPLFQ